MHVEIGEGADRGPRRARLIPAAGAVQQVSGKARRQLRSGLFPPMDDHRGLSLKVPDAVRVEIRVGGGIDEHGSRNQRSRSREIVRVTARELAGDARHSGRGRNPESRRHPHQHVALAHRAADAHRPRPRIMERRRHHGFAQRQRLARRQVRGGTDHRRHQAQGYEDRNPSGCCLHADAQACGAAGRISSPFLGGISFTSRAKAVSKTYSFVDLSSPRVSPTTGSASGRANACSRSWMPEPTFVTPSSPLPRWLAPSSAPVSRSRAGAVSCSAPVPSLGPNPMPVAVLPCPPSSIHLGIPLP